MKHLALGLMLFAVPAHAAETAAFLQQGIGARAIALGGTGTALSDDAATIYWNPANLVRSEKRNALFSHAELAEGTRLDFGGYSHPLGNGTIGGGFTYLSYGTLSGRDSLGRPTGNYGASDAALALAYALKLDKAAMGASIKYLRSHIAEAEAQSAALDLGIAKSMGNILTGLSMRNLGPGLKYADRRDDLPLTVAGGIGFKHESLTFGVDYENRPRVGQNDGGVGVEWKPRAGLSLRGGYSSKGSISGGSGFDAARGLALGLGVELPGFRLDYAIKPTGELGRAHRFDISARF